jgi:adenylosuccinate synthase
MLVNPFNMAMEAEHLMELGLRDPFERTTISQDALLVTPYHRAANRLKEDQRGHARHGSTGQGVGETRWYGMNYPATAPHISDMRAPYVMQTLLTRVRDYYTAVLGDLGVEESPRELTEMYLGLSQRMNIVPSEYVDTLLDSGDCVFEGAQGVLLDEQYGFNPHTTWTNTTQANARKLLAGREAECWGLTRAYHTRHGAGPFPSEGKSGAMYAPEPHNGTGKYQGAWRVGELDLSLLEYAIRANGGIDHLSVSHLDYMYDVLMEVNYGYEYWSVEGCEDWFDSKGRINLPATREDSYSLGTVMRQVQSSAYDLIQNPEDVIRTISEVIKIEPTLLAYGPTWKDRTLANVPAVS